MNNYFAIVVSMELNQKQKDATSKALLDIGKIVKKIRAYYNAELKKLDKTFRSLHIGYHPSAKPLKIKGNSLNARCN